MQVLCLFMHSELSVWRTVHFLCTMSFVFLVTNRYRTQNKNNLFGRGKKHKYTTRLAAWFTASVFPRLNFVTLSFFTFYRQKQHNRHITLSFTQA